MYIRNQKDYLMSLDNYGWVYIVNISTNMVIDLIKYEHCSLCIEKYRELGYDVKVTWKYGVSNANAKP